MESDDSEIKVLFVGDRPYKANTGPATFLKVPQSMRTLDSWTKIMGLKEDTYMVIYRTDEFFPECARSFYKTSRPIIALGIRAHDALVKAKIAHFHMFHPSGLKRHLNDKNQLSLALARCRQYITAHMRLRDE